MRLFARDRARNSSSSQLNFYRLLLLGCGLFYLAWWFSVQALLPGSFNPLPSRLAVVAAFWLTGLASFRSARVADRLAEGLAVNLWIATLHYFYLFHHNHDQLDWVIGSYITIIATSACFQEPRGLLAYSVWTLALATGLGALNPALFKTIFLPGLFTVLFFANLTLRVRVRLADRLRDSAQRLQSLFDAVFEGVAVQEQGVIVEANESLARILGCPRAELIGRRASDFVGAQSRDRLVRSIENGDETPYEATGRRPDGSEFTVEIAAKQHVLQGKAYRLAAIRDITEHKKAEKTRILFEASQQALQARDDFISTVSHELKTPLTIIKLQAQLLQRSLPNEAEGEARAGAGVRAFVAQTERQVNRLARLVEDMIDISRISAGQLRLSPVRTDLSELVREAAASLADAFREARCALQLRLEPGVVVQADRHRLEQVIVNLFTNALKYGSGRPVEVTCSAVPAGEGAAARARLTVRDFGFGIAAADHERVFQRFERMPAARDISGLGLGLYICRQIVEAHGGSITVESSPGQGASFTVELARADDGRAVAPG